MLLKDYVVKRPEGTKIQKGYVYKVIDSVYDPEKKYNVDSRKLIGKMIDEENMIPNEQFEIYYPDSILNEKLQSDFSDVLHIGMYTLIFHLLKQTKLNEVIEPLFSDHHKLIYDLIAYMICEESCDFEYFEYFERRVPCFTRKVYSDSSVSRLLSDRISVKDINAFLDAWNRINSDLCKDVYVNYDSTNFPLRNEYSGLAEYGYAKDDEDLMQVNLSYVTAKDNNRPLSYCLYPGSIHDTSEICHTLKQIKGYDYKNIGFVFDRAYYSEKLIRYLKENSYFFIMMLKDNYGFVKETIEEYRYKLSLQVSRYIEEYDVSGISKKVSISKNSKKPLYAYVHVYYSRSKAANDASILLNNVASLEKQLKEMYEERKSFTKEKYVRFEKYFRLRFDSEGHLLSYKKDEKKLEKLINDLGYFALLSEKKLSTKEVLSIYHQRDAIEKLFSALKSSLGFDHPGIHSKNSLEAKIFLAFLATVIRNEIFNCRNKLPLQEKKNFTVPVIIKQLSSIEASLNRNNTYHRRYALTTKQKKLLSLFSLNEKDIDETIKRFNDNSSKE